VDALRGRSIDASMGLSQRLSETDWNGSLADATRWRPRDFLLSRGVSPAISGEESGWVLWDWGVWS
jgi:hypothetical protein